MIQARPELERLIGTGLVTVERPHSLVLDEVSVELHLDSALLRYLPHPQAAELPSDLAVENIYLGPDESYLLRPGGCVLACSRERVSMPIDHMGFVQTKGSIARGFLLAHACDGQIDPGYSGHVTLELVNLSSITYVLREGLAIARLFVESISSPVRSYSGRYQGSPGPTCMRTAPEGGITT